MDKLIDQLAEMMAATDGLRELIDEQPFATREMDESLTRVYAELKQLMISVEAATATENRG